MRFYYLACYLSGLYTTMGSDYRAALIIRAYVKKEDRDNDCEYHEGQRQKHAITVREIRALKGHAQDYKRWKVDHAPQNIDAFYDYSEGKGYLEI